MNWIKDKNGAIYRIDAITAVVPMEQRADKRDQTKVTDTHATITTVGGHSHSTSLNFDDVIKLVNPPREPVEAPASQGPA